MIRKAIIGLLLATLLPAIICFASFRVYKVSREAAAVEHLRSHQQDFRANEIVPGLFLGDYESSLQFDYLNNRKITHVVAVLSSVILPPALDDSSNYTYLVVKAEDIKTQNLIDTFPFVYDFIKNATDNNGKVLVHCAKGVSRSSALVIAYLMKDRHLSFEDAFAIVKKGRPIVLPNEGFVSQLKQYNTIHKLSEKMIEVEEEKEKKEKKEERQAERAQVKEGEGVKEAIKEGVKEIKEELKEMKEEVKEEIKEYDIKGMSPAIYQCDKGECYYVHGNVFTDLYSDINLSVRYVIQQFLNKYTKKQ